MFKLARIVTKSNFVNLGALNRVKRFPEVQKRLSSSHEESYEEMDVRMIEFFKRPDLDSWWVRKGLQEIHHIDAAPEPAVIIEALTAIRRVNDFALAVRFLEAVKFKCGRRSGAARWNYILGEIQPTLSKLGIPTPHEMGYDKPELALKDPYFD